MVDFFSSVYDFNGEVLKFFALLRRVLFVLPHVVLQQLRMWGLCGATVAHLTHNQEVPGSIPGRSGKMWAVFPIPLRLCSPSSE